RIRSWSSVMRPKSMATVVVVLSPVWVRSSMPADADVMTASVRSGLISETAPTNVVLPTPKPPATTIFAEVVERLSETAPPLELAKSTEHPFEQCHVRGAGRLVATRLMHGDESRLREVRHQDPGHAQRHVEQCGDLGDRLHLTAQMADALVLREEPHERGRVGCRTDQCLDGQLIARPGPATGHRIGTDQWLVALVLVRLRVRIMRGG